MPRPDSVEIESHHASRRDEVFFFETHDDAYYREPEAVGQELGNGSWRAFKLASLIRGRQLQVGIILRRLLRVANPQLDMGTSLMLM